MNVAARLENLAEPGGICISDDVRSHVLNKIRLNVVDLGDQNLHNIPRAVRAFKLRIGRRRTRGRGRMGCGSSPPSADTWRSSTIAVVAV